MKVRAILTLGVALGAIAACASMRQPAPSYGIHASSDAGTIERGRYLVYGPAHCAACHGDPALARQMRQGHEVPLSGGRVFDLGPLGAIVAPNITNDAASGIGALSDDTFVRSLRYGVSHQGRPLLPFMSFADLADDDLRAILSFMRTTKPVAAPVRSRKLSWLGALGVKLMLRPKTPSAPPLASFPPARTPEYGRYLAHSVANCHGCHTRRSKWTGAFNGPAFAGGMVMQESGASFVTPNLTPATGSVALLTEREFIDRFRTNGRSEDGSPMPWAAYSRMTDTDLGAIYRYLRSLPPAQTPSG